MADDRVGSLAAVIDHRDLYLRWGQTGRKRRKSEHRWFDFRFRTYFVCYHPESGRIWRMPLTTAPSLFRSSMVSAVRGTTRDRSL